jgi:exonuclease III
MAILILQWNAHSLKACSAELKHFLSTSKTPPDLICVAETYLKPTQNFTLSGYEIVRKDRPGTQQGGGVATLIRSGLKFQNINLSCNKLEIVAIEIYLANNNKIKVVNVYDPPDHLVDLDDYKQVFSIGDRVIVTGDFNAHNPLWKSEEMDKKGECIESMLDSCGFTMLNTGQPTFQKTNGGTSVLDLLFASSSIANRCDWSVLNNALGSDHLPTITQFFENTQPENNDTKQWQLKTADWPKFQNSLNNIKSSQLFDTDVNNYNNNITNIIIHSANLSILKTTKQNKNKPKSVPYWNTACSNAVYITEIRQETN